MKMQDAKLKDLIFIDRELSCSVKTGSQLPNETFSAAGLILALEIIPKAYFF